MLEKKQVEGLSDFSSLVITGYSRSGNVVTLTRADGTKFSFTTYGGGGTKGAKGPVGETGDTGASAYEAYKRDGRTTAADETSWINSLKGEDGDTGTAGSNGAKGATGIVGNTPTFSVGTVTELSPGATPTASLTKSGDTYKINVGIPRGAAGTSGTAGTTPTLKIGTVSTIANNGTPTISISQSGTTYTINLGIPRGATGTAGTVSTGSNGTNPTVNFNVTMGSSTTVSKSVSGNTWTITLTVPNGDKGAKGATGATGAKGSSTVFYAPITTNTTTINSPAKNSFFSFKFANEADWFFGWSQSAIYSSLNSTKPLINQTAFWATQDSGSTYATSNGIAVIFHRALLPSDGTSFSSVSYGWWY